MGNRDKAARVPAAAASSKIKRGRQNKNIRNGIFMPPPAGMEAIKGNPYLKFEDEEFLNVFAKRKKGGVKSARSLLTSD